jgi:group I intron endonuclease
MKIIGIYKITSPSNKIYIGQSVDFAKRLSAYRRLHCKGQIKLYHSLNKHGFENHIIELIKECSQYELNTYERYYQELYDSINNGLNLRYTATNDKSGNMSQESKNRMSKAWENREYDRELLKTFTMKGKKHSKESILKMSLAQKGKPKSKEAIEKMAKSLTGRVGHKHTEIYKQFYRDNSVRCKAVLQYDMDMNFIKEWHSFSEVTRVLGLSNNMSHMIKGNISNIGGFIWKYKDC